METKKLLKALKIKSVDGKVVDLEPLANGIDQTLDRFSRSSAQIRANREDIRMDIILKFCENPISIDPERGKGYALGKMYTKYMCKAAIKEMSREVLMLDITAKSEDYDTDEDNNLAAACHPKTVSRPVMEWQAECSCQERLEDVRECMDSIENDIDRSIVKMRFVDGFESCDIADRLNISVSNVNTRFNRLKPALRSRLA